MSRGDSYQLQGQAGGDALTSTEGSTIGKWRVIQIVNDAVFTDLVTGNNGPISTIANLEGITHLAGTTLFGEFTTIHVASGVVIAYK